MNTCKLLRLNWAARFFMIVACVGITFSAASAFGQSQNESARERLPNSSTELGRENLGKVGAGAGELKAVLVKDAGLMVELKKWVARDATAHGQVVSERDLTDDAIFDRLEQDAEFRSVATELVQRYGYLTPRVNPESAMGKEQELLVQERVKWLAQHEEQVRAQQAAAAEEKFEKTRACEASGEANCAATMQGARNGAQGAPQEQEQQPGSLPMQPNQAPPSVPNLPPSNAAQLERAELMQQGAGANANPNFLGAMGSYGANEGTDSLTEPGEFGLGGAGSASLSPAMLQQMQQQGAGDASSLGPFASAMGGGTDMQGAMGGMSMNGMSTMGAGGGMNSAALAMEMNPFVGQETEPSEYANGASRGWIRRLNGSKEKESLQPAELVHAPNPYNDVPSLYDMYLQARPRPAALHRFGAEVFENGTRDSQMIPMDLPVGPDYVVGPGDALAIDVWGGVSRRLYRTVDREGRVSLPEVGPVLVSGKSLADVQQDLQQTLRTQFRDISADVSLSRLRTIRVYEVGDIQSPGAYDVSSLSTPLNALFEAGGPTARGSMRIVKHYRGDQLVQEVDLYDLLLHGVKSGIERLENGDTVLVPPMGPQVTIEGMVRRPAIYELKDEKTLASALELAGGLLPTATLRHVEVERIEAHEKKTMLSLDIPDAGDEAEVTKKLEAFQIQDGDKIRVYPIAPYNQNAIYLEGHVLRPGSYSYRDGMRVTDLIASYKDLLPEPAAQYAEIIRLNAPDFHPSVESFDLAEALANPEQAPELHAMDTVRVYSRYDFENPPVVAVLGDVRGPGTYRTSGQIHVSDAVHLAGGLAPDAERGDAQVFRHEADGKMKIFSVSLTGALAGDPAANIVLEPRDELLVHRSPDAVQPATVYIQGAVGNPGRYPLTTNMTVADLIRVGGGLKPSADTQTADLTRYEWASASATNVTAQQETIPIGAALSGTANANQALHNGDVLTVRELPGWNDLGASIAIRGEVKHPGTYGIRPGERLSSVLQRAGGFQPDAYPYGAILQRVDVRELETKQQDEMILRVKDEQSNLELLPETDAKQKQAKEMVLTQWQTTLEQLSSNPPLGRVDIRIGKDIHRWANTNADIAVRAGDTLTIPKRPDYVMVTGQVYNPTAVSYRPGKSAKWYLGQSGGPTQLANKKGIFVIRADGSVIGTKGGLWSGESLSAALEPGDTVVVPERAAPVGGVPWQNIFMVGQLASATATTLYIALHY